MKSIRRIISFVFFICLLTLHGSIYAEHNSNSIPPDTTQTLLSDIQNAKRIAWVCPHCDDEMFIVGLISLATYRYKKEVYVISGSLIQGKLRQARQKDNSESKTLLRLKDYIRYDPSEYKKQSLKVKPFIKFVRDILVEKDIDMVITLDPVQGYNSQPQHIETSKMVTKLMKHLKAEFPDKKLKLYYLINSNPDIIGRARNLSHDIEPYSDIINMDTEKIILPDGKEVSLWAMREKILDIYSDSIPALMAGNADLLNKNLRHFELYQKAALDDQN